MENVAGLSSAEGFNLQLKKQKQDIISYLRTFEQEREKRRMLLPKIPEIAIEVTMETFKIKKIRKFLKGKDENEVIARSACMALIKEHTLLSNDKISLFFRQTEENVCRRINKITEIKSWGNKFSELVIENERIFKLKIQHA